jgi:hypothetical protein
MAEIVEFKVINSDPYEYAAIVQGKYDPSWDNSGVFVRESDYAALLERHRRLVHAIRFEEFTTAIKLALAEEVE